MVMNNPYGIFPTVTRGGWSTSSDNRIFKYLQRKCYIIKGLYALTGQKKCDMKQGVPELDVIKDIPQGILYHLCKMLLNLPFTYFEKEEPLEECGTYIDLIIVHFILYFNLF